MSFAPDSIGLRAEMCEIGRRLYARGLCSGFDGNLSCRLENDRLLCTPTGCCKGFLAPDDLCVTDLSGVQLQGSRTRTSEILLHCEIYRGRPDIAAVIHSHPPCATAFAMAGKGLPAGVLAEAEYYFGEVPVAPYELPGTARFAETVRPFLSDHVAILLANHGVVVFASSLNLAWALTESLENYAHSLALAGGVPPPRALTDDQRRELAELKRAHQARG